MPLIQASSVLTMEVKYGELLFIENGKKWRGSLSGKVLPLYHQ
ncbi:hypothetical protein [Colwellia piezophila]|nr:hypothetical protein [Colwellia piezophila]